jgi:uncharacterized protein (TIGR03085 family)
VNGDQPAPRPTPVTAGDLSAYDPPGGAMGEVRMGSVVDAALAEHRAMADTLVKVGPDAPTILAGWTTTELAAHLASLEAMGGVPLFLGRQLITRVHPRPTEGSRKMAARQLEKAKVRGWDRLVDQVRSPHRLPMRAGGAPVALFEIYTHHQDVLRAAPDLPEEPAPDELASCLPWILAFHTKRLDGVELVARTDAGEHRAGAGAPVVVAGDVGEVVLWLAGRDDHCSVEIEAAPDVVDQVQAVTSI